MAGTFFLGVLGLAGIYGVLWLIGLGAFASGLATGSAPYALIGLMMIMMLAVAGVVIFAAYMIGKGIRCKITGERFDI